MQAYCRLIRSRWAKLAVFITFCRTYCWPFWGSRHHLTQPGLTTVRKFCNGIQNRKDIKSWTIFKIKMKQKPLYVHSYDKSELRNIPSYNQELSLFQIWILSYTQKNELLFYTTDEHSTAPSELYFGIYFVLTFDTVRYAEDTHWSTLAILEKQVYSRFRKKIQVS